jgi:hypothetical protein
MSYEFFLALTKDFYLAIYYKSKNFKEFLGLNSLLGESFFYLFFVELSDTNFSSSNSCEYFACSSMFSTISVTSVMILLDEKDCSFNYDLPSGNPGVEGS